MIVALFKYLLIILPITSAVTTKFKCKQEESILITYLLSLIVLYLFGLFNIIKIGLYLLIVCAIISIIYIIYSLIKKNVKISELITMPTIGYIFVLSILCFYLKGNGFHEWDELSHWGTNLKFMVSKDLLWANNEFNGIHIVYQPLIGIAEWLINKMNGTFAEDISYLGYEIFLITLIMPLFKNLKYKFVDVIKYIFVFGIFLLTRLIFRFPLITIYIDYSLGLLFGITFYIATIAKDKKDYVILFLLMVALVLLKDTGLIFAGIIVMYLFILNVILKIFENKKISKQILKTAGIIIGFLIVLVVIYMSWKIYCNINGQTLDIGHDHNYISEKFNLNDLIETILKIDTVPEKLSTIYNTFYSYLINNSLITFFIELTPIKIFGLLNVISFLIILFEKDKKIVFKNISIAVAFDIGFVLYLIVLLSTYLFAMTDAEGYRLASFERYLDTYFMSWLLTIIFMFLSNIKNIKTTLISLIIINLLLFANVNIFDVIYNHTYDTAVTNEMIELTDRVKEVVNEDENIYIIVQNSSQKFIQHQIRFLLSPIATNDMSEFSLGEKYNEKDYDSKDLSIEEWSNILINDGYEYVLIVDADELFYNKYEEIFKDPGDTVEDIQWKLFKVNKIDNNVKLSIIE